jgi:hypothetical protein
MIVDVMATPADTVGLKADPQGTRAPPPNLWVGLQPHAFRTPTPSA